MLSSNETKVKDVIIVVEKLRKIRGENERKGKGKRKG